VAVVVDKTVLVVVLTPEVTLEVVDAEVRTRK